jgi:hypothetical protein
MTTRGFQSSAGDRANTASWQKSEPLLVDNGLQSMDVSFLGESERVDDQTGNCRCLGPTTSKGIEFGCRSIENSNEKALPGVAKLEELKQLGLGQAVFIPIQYGEKRPQVPGWQKKTLPDMANPTYQSEFDGEVNIGILLGRPSSGLCVIDIEDEAAVEPFLEINPQLHHTLRTKGSRGCSLWLNVEGEYPKPGRFKSAAGKLVMEWRGDGQQCVIQGKHPKGHDYQIIHPVAPLRLRFSEINWPIGLIKPWDKPTFTTITLPAGGWKEGISSTDALELARKYVEKAPPAISGEGGHDRTFAVACSLVKGFNLPIENARPLMEEYNQRCVPRWSSRELEHKLLDADGIPDDQPRGYLLPSTGDLPIIQLPGNSFSIRESARRIFLLIAPGHEFFSRGGAVCELVRQSNGRLVLDIVRPSAFRSRAEKYGRLVAERSGKHADPVLKPTVMPEETAKALLDTVEARKLLPTITGVVNCPVIRNVVSGVKIIGQGYDPESGLLVSGGQLPSEVPLDEAAAALQAILDEFDFSSAGDRSRAIASLLTPALKLGGFISGKVPADVAEADQSQAGKTYRQRVIAAVYNEILSPVVQRTGGVGSIDESFAQQLISGNPFIQLDNLRDKLDSQYLESFMTATESFPARVPHSREIMVNPEWFFVYLTSNGVHTTRDFANRSSVVRIKKRTNFRYRQYGEGDLLAHVRANQQYYLGCVFAVVREWVRLGKNKTNETRHDFREWVQTLDWIVQNLFETAPLMDGHLETQERISNPAMTLLRTLALYVVEEGRLGESFTASKLVDLCENHGLEIPGLRSNTAEAGMKRIGVLLGNLFKQTNCISLDDFEIMRTETSFKRSDGEGYRPQKSYSFHRMPPVPRLPKNGANNPIPPHRLKINKCLENRSIFL